MCEANLAEGASNALMYLRQKQKAAGGRELKTKVMRRLRIICVGSPEAVLAYVAGLSVNVELFPRILKGQRFILEVQKHFTDFSSWRQKASQFALKVTREAEAPSGDDGNAQSQANLLTVRGR